MTETKSELSVSEKLVSGVVLVGFTILMAFASSLLDGSSNGPEPLREGASAEVQRMADYYGLPRLQVESDFRRVGQDFTVLKAGYRAKYGY